MSILDSLLISVFGLGIVFVVLIALSWIISFESRIFGTFKGGKKGGQSDEPEAAPALEPTEEAAAGELKLHNVDEKTAAVIMAIVSDESKIPLSELQFRSIKAMD